MYGDPLFPDALFPSPLYPEGGGPRPKPTPRMTDRLDVENDLGWTRDKDAPIRIEDGHDPEDIPSPGDGVSVVHPDGTTGVR